ncbi:hypothetical protein [Larkinella soli]|uniref:hypothetical protein n=1 Tax=Larkinella soli TaxID=1770527 RepID=UPI001E393E09|nr:hypothetical protein [Larkinella soli]
MSALLFSATGVRAQQLRLAYYGETVTHYGLKAGYEIPVGTRHLRNETVRKEILFAPGIAVYRHPHNHTGIVVSPELAYRRTGPRGGFYELALAPSYFRYFLAGTTFEVDETGAFRRVPLAGRNAFLPTVSLGFGKDLSVRKRAGFSWYARLNLMQQRPYNASSLLRFSLEAGIIKPLKKS